MVGRRIENNCGASTHGATIRLLSLLIILLAPFAANAQTLELAAAPNPAALYQKVSLTVLVPSANPETVSATFPSNSGSIHVVSGPYVQPFVTGDSSTRPTVRVSFVVEGNEAGRVVVPPLDISADNKSYTTKPVVLSFGVPRGGRLVVPLHPVWTVKAGKPKGVYYAGESIPVILELKNEIEKRTIDSISVPNPPPGLEQTKELGRVSQTPVGGTTLLQIPVASFILTPTDSGTVVLPSATVTAGNLSGTSVPKELRILPPPEAIAETGAIGSFSFRSWTTKRSVADGEEVSLHLRIEGSGNLEHLVLPVPGPEGLLEIGKTETHHIAAGRSGYTGFREIVYQYLLQPSAAGSTGISGGATLTVPAFNWLDLEGGVQSTAAQTFAIPAPAAPSTPPSARSAGAGESAKKANPARGKVPFDLESAQVIRRSEYHEYYSNGKTYLWLLPGPLVFGLFLLTRPRGKGGRSIFGAATLFLLLAGCSVPPVQDTVESGITAYSKGKVEQSVKDLTAARLSYPQNAALSFDIALAEYRLGRYGEAIHAIRTAIYFSPLSEHYRTVLQWMVDQIGVPEQVPPAYPIHPDLFLFILIAGVNLAAILGILVVIKRSGRLAIALILALVISIIAGGGLAYTAVRRSAETAVVKSSGTEMTKIPMAVAGHWLELPAGMAVEIRDSVSGYYLVETAYGNTGWVRKERVLLDGRQP